MSTVAFFHWLTGVPVRIFAGTPEDVQAATGEARWSGCAVRELDETPFADERSLSALPGLVEFDAIAASGVRPHPNAYDRPLERLLNTPPGDL